MTSRVRLTITVTPEVYDIFTAMAETSGRSLGRCMGDWLEDTSEGAELTVHRMEELRRAPAAAQAAFLRAAADSRTVQALVESHEARGRPGMDAQRPLLGVSVTRRPLGAPSSNTGLKVHRTGTQKGRK